MSKIVYKTLHCAMCGRKHRYPVMVSRNVAVYSLEGKTFPNTTHPPVQKCPACGYCSYHIEGEITENQRKAYQNGEYQSFLCKFPDDLEGQARTLAAWMEQLEGTAIQAWLEAAWYWEDRKEKEASDCARLQAARGLSESMEKEPDINVSAVIVLIDSLRQLGEFQAAEEGIRGLQMFIDPGTPEQQALYLEQHAIAQKNRDTLCLGDEVTE